MAAKRERLPDRPALYHVSLARWLAIQLERFARAVERAEERGHPWKRMYEGEIQGLDRAAEAWRDAEQSQSASFFPLGAARVLDFHRTRLLEIAPDLDELAAPKRRLFIQNAAERIVREVAGDARGLGRIPKWAWEPALLEWRGMKRRKQSGAHRGSKAKPASRGYAEILFELLKSGGLTANVKSARQLEEILEKARR